MKDLRKLLTNHQHKHESIRLFSELRQKKLSNIAPCKKQCNSIIQSKSNHDDEEEKYTALKQRVELFKISKAKDVIDISRRTNKNIDDVVAQLKSNIHKQLKQLIYQNLKNSIAKNWKEGSTMPGSQNSKIQTPGFDCLSSKRKINQLTIDLRQFTLGQREQGSSNTSNKSLKGLTEHNSIVSEFKVMNREPSSKRIKDKIMNSGKSRK